MTDEMLELARANAAEAGVENVDFLKGYMEDIPLADETVDVVISNCVINLAADSIAGAPTREEFEGALVAGGLTGVEIQETHRVHEHAGSAIVRARKPERG